jgi:hypothetical protein
VCSLSGDNFQMMILSLIRRIVTAFSDGVRNHDGLPTIRRFTVQILWLANGNMYDLSVITAFSDGVKDLGGLPALIISGQKAVYHATAP